MKRVPTWFSCGAYSSGYCKVIPTKQCFNVSRWFYLFVYRVYR